jgi:uncharacterized protein YbbC (DUF1343 family)
VGQRIITGLDRIKKSLPKTLKDKRIGLLVHPASVSRRFVHAADVFSQSKNCMLRALFGPQHGIRGETQDNMIEWEGFQDHKTGLPIHSLYGKARKPDRNMIRTIDIMVVDLQDIGARYYTYVWTMALVMQSCQQFNKTLVVLDRPNPIGGHKIEGPVLEPDYSSFVGLHRLPVRHGMTIGEMALYLKDMYYTSLDLLVIHMSGWKRTMWFDATGLPWVPPSPNMPSLDTATVYPGMCLLEGTNISEGRGTTRPFEIFGAPFIEPESLVKRLKEFRLPGVIFRPLFFLPTFQKYSGTLCGGAQLHVSDREKFKPFKTAVAVLKAVRDLYEDDFTWNNPPYEYEEVLLPIDILSGGDRIRRDIDAGVDVDKMESRWSDRLREFDKLTRKKYLLY